ncbi:Stp1/IreP family PP2C-type Ser/Thr phosphatase [Ottowia testudinis]|uniref:Stp1/IreP family PP2C-type Ser/Thr phosphatase n=1 Tax=Ottowia testudinis TaxID=2816950 RepID=A0A975CIH9_9BURK|nr:Stp1/IreP family PP2C-type Ser/Thr phosphatase [Ottowia testudinis]QTD45577.1 Stp1/IreP family PP2C-type Ser/Thr phosphatase [Ottowia testudinis]
MRFEYSAISDIGRHRANNEDAVMVDAEHGVVVLADGMGGYNAGEVASALAVDLIAGELGRWLKEAASVASMRDVRRAMEICVDNANRAIFDAAHTHEAYAGMGTTLVMGALHQGVLVIGHVGDSRAYRWRGGVLAQLTRDHSLLQEQVDIGLITPEEAAASGNRNLVTRALGVEDTVLLDLQEVDVAWGDVFLLCSDGLNDMLSDEDIAAVLAAGEPLEQTTQRLIDLANQRGGRDNVSVIMVKAHEPPKKTGVMSKLLRK